MKFNVTIVSPSPLIALGTLIFNGTGVWLESAMESTNYTLQIAGSLSYSGLSPPTDDMFGVTDLPASVVHNLTITPASILGSAVVEMDLDADSIVTVDDKALFDSPPGGTSVQIEGTWTQNQCLGSGRFDGTCHTTSGSGSSIVYTFEGDGITLWGSVENAQSSYTVSIDGSSPTTYTSANGTLETPAVVLAHASSLGPGSHTITLANTPLDGGSRLEVDYAALYTNASEVSSPADTKSSSSTSYKSHTPAILAGVLSGCAAVALALVFAFLWRRRRAAKDDASFIDRAPAYSGAKRFRPMDPDQDTLAESFQSGAKLMPGEQLPLGRIR